MPFDKRESNAGIPKALDFVSTENEGHDLNMFLTLPWNYFTPYRIEISSTFIRSMLHARHYDRHGNVKDKVSPKTSKFIYFLSN